MIIYERCTVIHNRIPDEFERGGSDGRSPPRKATAFGGEVNDPIKEEAGQKTRTSNRAHTFVHKSEHRTKNVYFV